MKEVIGLLLLIIFCLAFLLKKATDRINYLLAVIENMYKDKE